MLVFSYYCSSRVVTVVFVAMIIIAFSLCNSQLFVVVDQWVPRLLSYDWN